MRLWDPKGLHESSDVIGEKFSGIGAFRFIGFASPPQVQRNAVRVLGIFFHLEGVTGVIGAQEGNENERLIASLLVIVHRDVVCLDLRHASLS